MDIKTLLGTLKGFETHHRAVGAIKKREACRACIEMVEKLTEGYVLVSEEHLDDMLEKAQGVLALLEAESKIGDDYLAEEPQSGLVRTVETAAKDNHTIADALAAIREVMVAEDLDEVGGYAQIWHKNIARICYGNLWSHGGLEQDTCKALSHDIASDLMDSLFGIKALLPQQEKSNE